MFFYVGSDHRSSSISSTLDHALHDAIWQSDELDIAIFDFDIGWTVFKTGRMKDTNTIFSRKGVQYSIVELHLQFHLVNNENQILFTVPR